VNKKNSTELFPPLEKKSDDKRFYYFWLPIMRNFVRNICFCAVLISMYGCSAKVKTQIISVQTPLSEFATVVILYPEQLPPADATPIGTLKIGDSGFSTQCTYDDAINATKNQARLNGSNFVHINQIKNPDGFSTCYRIKASLYKIPDALDYTAKAKAFEDSITRVKIQDDTTAALLHIYREFFYLGYAISYKVNLNDSTICRAKHGTVYTLRLENPECYTISAKTETSYELNLCFEPGQEYYLRCSVGMGAFVGRPIFQIVDKTRGRIEVERLNEE
jgi:hypothetical protein